MANFSIKFYDHKDHQTTIECFSTIDNTIRVFIERDGLEVIDMDKSTAIKFAKTLRTEINKIQE